ncbi:MAG: hypothetical protein AB1758_28880, partial [Candidatus Eremiobacterota bacterium]
GQAHVAVPSSFSKYDRVYPGQTLQIRDDSGRLLEQKGPPGRETLQAVVTRARLDLGPFSAWVKNGSVVDPAGFVSALEQELTRRAQTTQGPVYGSAVVQYGVR